MLLRIEKTHKSKQSLKWVKLSLLPFTFSLLLAFFHDDDILQWFFDITPILSLFYSIASNDFIGIFHCKWHSQSESKYGERGGTRYISLWEKCNRMENYYVWSPWSWVDAGVTAVLSLACLQTRKGQEEATV